MKYIACRLIRLAALAVLFACTAVALHGHADTRTVTGVITDQSGAVMPGVLITLSGPGGISRTAAADGTRPIHLSGTPDGRVPHASYRRRIRSL